MGLSLVALALIAGATPAPTAHATGACDSTLNTIFLETFSATMAPARETYRIGETARFAVTVTRPGDEDPLGAGVPLNPPVRRPAPDVRVALGLTVKDVYLWGTGLTNDAGKTTVRVKLRPYTPVGRGHADGLAMKTQADSPCLIVEEIGSFSKNAAIRVVR